MVSPVLDAAISQRERTLSLALVVEHGTSKERAKQLGENFVRSTKSLSKDASPNKSIGKGMYDYLVSVHYPNGDEVVMGAKVSISDRIIWR